MVDEAVNHGVGGWRVYDLLKEMRHKLCIELVHLAYMRTPSTVVRLRIINVMVGQ